ncbi:MAG: hypothetical protein HYT89_04725 [Candidatus Omnitrophica bacterium]|nr:hypothetical protein [Candidatus Omnitrophota bacterium]
MNLARNGKTIISYDDHMLDHGNSLTKLVRDCKEELVMLIEDDAFILKPGRVEACFSQIESGKYDCLGSPRGSCHAKIFERGMEKFGNPAIGFDAGPNFWPNFFFCKKSDLLKTDMNFCGRTFQKGHYIPALDWAVDENSAHSDTFVWGSLQMRALGLKIGYIEQYKMHPNDFDECRSKTNCFSGKAGWLHSGNLSGSLHSWLRTEEGYPLAHVAGAAPVDMNVTPEEAKGHGSQDEFERRAAFLLVAYEAAVLVDDYRAIGWFRDVYKKSIDLLITRFQLNPERFEKRVHMYKKLLAPLLSDRGNNKKSFLKWGWWR